MYNSGLKFSDWIFDPITCCLNSLNERINVYTLIDGYSKPEGLE